MYASNGLLPPQPLLGPGCFWGASPGRGITPGREERLQDTALPPPVSVLTIIQMTLAVKYSRNHPCTHCSAYFQFTEQCLPHRSCSVKFLSKSMNQWPIYFPYFVFAYTFSQKYYLFANSIQQIPNICIGISHISNAVHQDKSWLNTYHVTTILRALEGCSGSLSKLDMCLDFFPKGQTHK